MFLRIKIIALTALLLVGGMTIVHFYSQARRLSLASGKSASVFSEGPRVGQHAPDFSLTDLDGRVQTLAAQRGHRTVLAFFCGCDRCHAAAKQIGIMQRQGKMRSFVSVVALDRKAARQFQTENRLQGMILSDPNDTTAERYDSDLCPRLWRISAEGVIRYRSEAGLEGTRLAAALTTAEAQLQ